MFSARAVQAAVRKLAEFSAALARRVESIGNRSDSLPRWAWDGGNGSVVSVYGMDEKWWSEFDDSECALLLTYMVAYYRRDEHFMEVFNKAQRLVKPDAKDL